jgi:hypothetical protein
LINRIDDVDAHQGESEPQDGTDRNPPGAEHAADAPSKSSSTSSGARRWSVSDGRTLTSVLLVIAGVFLVCDSLGAGSWVVAAIGVAVLAAAVAFYVVSALNTPVFAYIPGSAHVVSCSPPASAAQGRCEMHLVVHAPGMDDVAVKIRDAGYRSPSGRMPGPPCRSWSPSGIPVGSG